MTDTVYRTPPQAETKAETEARAAGYSALVPREKIWRRAGKNRSRVAQITRPIAPGYIIASGKPHDAKHIRNRIGTLTPNESAHMQSLNGLENVNPFAEPARPDWKPDDAVKIISGPFAGVEGVILEVRGRTVIVQGAWQGSIRSISLHEKQIAHSSPLVRR